MRVVIAGAGAMGTLFGARIAAAGHDVRMIDVDPARIAAIDAEGLHVEGGGAPLRATVRAGVAERFTEPADLVLIFTKGYHTAAAAASVAPLLTGDGMVLTLQNGLGNGETIADVVGAGCVLIGMTTWPADLIGHGRVHVGGTGSVRLWSMDTIDPAPVRQISAMLDGAGLNCSADPDVRDAIWEKVIFNAAFNGTAALTRMTVGQMADDASARRLIDTIVAEGVAIAVRAAIGVDPQRLRDTVDFALRNHRAHKPSMLQDVEQGRRTEVDTILGALTAASIRLDVSAPVLATYTALIQAIDARQR